MINHQAFKGSDLYKRLNKDIKDAFAIKGAERIFNPIFSPSSQAQMIADEFALKAGIGVMNNEGVWGIRVRDDAVFLTYSGDDYCGMSLFGSEMTCCSKSAVDFVKKNFGQVWNVSSFLDKVRPIILSTSNVERAINLSEIARSEMKQNNAEKNNQTSQAHLKR